MTDKDYIINNHLQELRGNSKYEIVHGEPDIIGWRVIGMNNQEVGKVHDLIFDESTNRVKYVIIDVDGKPLNLVSRLVLVPIELVEMLTGDKVVVVSELTVGELATLPTYEKDKVTTETEHAVDTVFHNAGVNVHADGTGNAYQPPVRDERYSRPKTEVVERKAEIREDIKQAKETIKKIEQDLDKL
jgi:sporulation protein YlmC with PRC-barrel domain